MTLIKSIFLGHNGSYTILGVSVNFMSENPDLPSNTKKTNVINQSSYKFTSIDAFRIITQAYLHTLVHEMGHAIAAKVLLYRFSYNFQIISIFTNCCRGQCEYPYTAARWKVTIIAVAGSMTNIAFCTCKLVAATALKNYLSWPVSLVLGGGAVGWIFGELRYACRSLSSKQGDFADIASKGNGYLALAGTAMISQVALALFLAVKLAA